MNLGKKGPKIQVSSMMDRKGDKILSTRSIFCPSNGLRAGFVIENRKIMKSIFLYFTFEYHFISFLLVNSHFCPSSLIGYHFFRMSQLHNNIDVSLNEHQLVIAISRGCLVTIWTGLNNCETPSK